MQEYTHVSAEGWWKPEEGIRCPAAGVTDRCELPDVGAWKLAPGPWKKSTFLNSLLPPLVYLLLLKVTCLFISSATMCPLGIEKDSRRSKSITSCFFFNTTGFGVKLQRF